VDKAEAQVTHLKQNLASFAAEISHEHFSALLRGSISLPRFCFVEFFLCVEIVISAVDFFGGSRDENFYRLLW